jgi:hypothetical protein
MGFEAASSDVERRFGNPARRDDTKSNQVGEVCRDGYGYGGRVTVSQWIRVHLQG